MSKRSDGQARGKYTLEFKLEAVRLVKGGQSAAVTAKVLGIPNQTLDNWVRLTRNKHPESGIQVPAATGVMTKPSVEARRLRAATLRASCCSS